MTVHPYEIHYASSEDIGKSDVPQLFAGETPAVGTVDVLLPSGAREQFVPLGTNYGAWEAGQTITGVTAYKVLATHMVPTANWSDKQDWAYLGMPKCGSDLCLCGFSFTVGTSFGIVNGNMLIGAQ